MLKHNLRPTLGPPRSVPTRLFPTRAGRRHTRRRTWPGWFPTATGPRRCASAGRRSPSGRRRGRAISRASPRRKTSVSCGSSRLNALSSMRGIFAPLTLSSVPFISATTRGRKKRRGAGQPAADHHQPVHQGNGVGQGVADALAEGLEGPPGGRPIAGRWPMAISKISLGVGTELGHRLPAAVPRRRPARRRGCSRPPRRGNADGACCAGPRFRRAAPLSPRKSWPSWTMPAPKPVPSVTPNRFL